MALGHVHLTPQFVQAIRDVIDVVDIASDHTRLSKSGKGFQGLCPLHREKTPSFRVDPQKGVFYCFGCGAGGDAIRLAMLLSGDDFPTTLETLARRYGVPVPTAKQGRSEGREQGVDDALEAALELYRKALRSSVEARRYLEDRRISEASIERFRLGYAPPGWTTLLEALRGRIPTSALEAAGLVGSSQRGLYDRFRHRLVFPITTASGRVVGFGGRTLGEDRAKYLNTAETVQFHKGSLLYGLFEAKTGLRERGEAILVEGYFDLLGAVEAGLEGVVATMGTALTETQARLLTRYVDGVAVAYDGDAAGDAATRRALPILLRAGLAVRRLRLPEGQDPDSLRIREGDEVLRQIHAEAPDAVELEVQRLAAPEVAREPRRQAEAARQVVELLQPVRDPILRFGYTRLAADRLGVPVDLLWRQVRSDRRDDAPPADGEVRRSREVQSLEEAILQTLLESLGRAPEDRRGAWPPTTVELPPPEAFLDPVCRNIYRVLVDLYEGLEHHPEVADLLAALAEQDEAVDRVGRLVVEDRATLGGPDVDELVTKLLHRYLRVRGRALDEEIREAERSGDKDRLDRLVAEKVDLSRSLHRPSG